MNKTDWPDGPWNTEPDKKQWYDETTDMACLIVRNGAGALCGYVGVTRDHPLYGEDYDVPDVTVHGGLTYAAPCDPAGHICHTPDPGKPDDVWWFGFDCAHSGDFIPYLRALGIQQPQNYKDLSYVEGEVASLAAQLHGGYFAA